jgi:hypothetical protein
VLGTAVAERSPATDAARRAARRLDHERETGRSDSMKKPQGTKPSTAALKVQAGLKAGRIGLNHNRRMPQASALKVQAGLKAGRIATNHNRRMR